MARKRSDEIKLAKEKGRDDWYIYWYDPGAQRVRRKSTGTSDRLLAEEVRLEFLRERARGAAALGPVPPEKYLVLTALRLFGDERAPEIKSGAQAGYAIGHLIRHLDTRTVADLTPQVIKGYERARAAEGISRGTIRRELAVLTSAITHAIKNHRLTAAPRIFLPAPNPGRTRFLDDSEIAALLDACRVTPHLYVFAQVALNTGARRGAVLDLTWPQVRFEQGLIYLNPPDREQTSKGRATVPMSDPLRTVLLDAYERRASEFVVEYRGGRITDIKTAFNKAVKRAGLAGVTTHVLRHTAGSVMAREGVPLFIISKMLGHSDTKTTELYAHLRPEWLREGVAALGRVTSRNAVSPTISPAKKLKGLANQG